MLIAVVALAFAGDGDWNQWRGPNRDAVADVSAPKWPERLTPKWKVEVGEGHASPVLGGGRVYVFARFQDRETLRALDPASGKVLWQQAYAAPYEMNPPAAPHGKGPKSTPVFADGRVFTLGINGMLAAWDAASGKQLWSHDFKTAPAFGVAMSPIVFEGLLIAHGGGDGNGSLTAFDAKSGTVKWAWKEDGPGYASPVVAMVGGVPHLITQTQKNVIGVNARTGVPLWKIPFTTPYEQNSVTPMVRGDVLIYSGLDNGVTAARLTAKGPETLWKSAAVGMYMNSPVWQGDALCGLSHKNKGQYFCLDSSNGKALWTSPGRQGENAAMVLTKDGAILSLDTDGKLQAIALGGSQFRVLKTYTAATSATWAHPAVVAGGILVKDFKTLAFLGW